LVLYDVVILGAGASGLMCASHLGDKKVAIVEHNSKVAKKLKISGGSKCNLTNVDVTSKKYLGDSSFIDTVFDSFSRDDLLNYFSNTELVIRDKRYYFCKYSSQQIVDIITPDREGVEIFFNTKVNGVTKEDDTFLVSTSGGKINAKSVVVATGAKSYEVLGATDIGLSIAKSFGMEIDSFLPALVGLTVQKEQFWMKELSGISANVHIKVGDRVVKESLLFTHKGISGLAVLSASLYWHKGSIEIDFLPKGSLQNIIKRGGNRSISSALPLPKRLAKALLVESGVQDKRCSLVSKDDLSKLEKIKSYSFAPAGNFGFSKAEACKGGVKTDELTTTLESKKVKNLFFIGEVVDVTGELGGYNLQWAFSSAVVCAKELNVQ
jgi:predicted Rossmann fold flavoprotein